MKYPFEKTGSLIIITMKLEHFHFLRHFDLKINYKKRFVELE